MNEGKGGNPAAPRSHSPDSSFFSIIRVVSHIDVLFAERRAVATRPIKSANQGIKRPGRYRLPFRKSRLFEIKEEPI